MTYKIDTKEGLWNVYSPKIGMYVMEDATVDQVKSTLAIEMEYKTKLEIIKLLITFPHGFFDLNDKLILNQEGMDEFDSWYQHIHQKILYIEDYYRSIDEKIEEILQS